MLNSLTHSKTIFYGSPTEVPHKCSGSFMPLRRTSTFAQRTLARARPLSFSPRWSEPLKCRRLHPFHCKARHDRPTAIGRRDRPRPPTVSVAAVKAGGGDVKSVKTRLPADYELCSGCHYAGWLRSVGWPTCLT